jgi:protein TonB
MRLRDISISVLGHAALAATVLVWPLSAPPAPPVIYEVALADMAPAPSGASAPSAPQAASPAPPKPTPHKTVPQPAERVISAHKAQDAAAPAPAPTPTEQPPASSAPPGPASPSAQGVIGGGRPGAQMRNFGGVSAYDANSVDERPSVLRGAMPEYPHQARRMRQEGRVLVRVVVDEQGSPVTALVLEANPAGVFEQAALGAARRFRFLPGKIAGRRVMTAVLIPFEFTLR